MKLSPSSEAIGGRLGAPALHTENVRHANRPAACQCCVVLQILVALWKEGRDGAWLGAPALLDGHCADRAVACRYFVALKVSHVAVDVMKVVEAGLGHLPFTEKTVTTPTGQQYVGVDFAKRLCGVSIIRSGESMENALRACCKGIKIGKILVHRCEPASPPSDQKVL